VNLHALYRKLEKGSLNPWLRQYETKNLREERSFVNRTFGGGSKGGALFTIAGLSKGGGAVEKKRERFKCRTTSILKGSEEKEASHNGEGKEKEEVRVFHLPGGCR